MWGNADAAHLPSLFFFFVDNLYTTISKYMCGLSSMYQINQKIKGKKMGRLVKDCLCPRLRRMRLCTASQVYLHYSHSRRSRFSPCPKAGRGSAPTGDMTVTWVIIIGTATFWGLNYWLDTIFIFQWIRPLRGPVLIFNDLSPYPIITTKIYGHSEVQGTYNQT